MARAERRQLRLPIGKFSIHLAGRDLDQVFDVAVLHLLRTYGRDDRGHSLVRAVDRGRIIVERRSGP